jgi:hypothetical protein
MKEAASDHALIIRLLEAFEDEDRLGLCSCGGFAHTLRRRVNGMKCTERLFHL